MSATRFHHSRARRHWQDAFHKVAATYLERKSAFAKVNPTVSDEERLHIQWRLGYNLFYSNQYYEAIGILELVCRNGKTEEEVQAAKSRQAEAETKAAKAGIKEGSLLASIAAEQEAEKKTEGDDDLLHGNYHVHLIAGRCCVKLFLQTKNHYHLENAYAHYQNCIESLTVPNDWEKKTLLRLPAVLHEMGHLLEHYGAFPSAIETYNQVMGDYQHYRGYFDVLYRSALVGLHLAGLMSKQEDSNAMLNHCMDSLQFLLEGLPTSIDEAHAVLLYARTLDKSPDPGIKYRANGVYKNLFDVLRSSKRLGAEAYPTYKEWFDDMQNWFKLGADIEAAGEPLLAKEAYELFVARLEASKLSRAVSLRAPGKAPPPLLDAASAMRLARNFASFQNYAEAARFADMALQHNRLDKEVRGCLSKWSKIHAVKLSKEEAAINTLHDRWRTRAWSNNFRARLKTATVSELEDKISARHFDAQARGDLAYFARDKWRARFLFETSCAVRLQRFIRGRIKIWRAQQRLRTRYLNRAVEAYRLYLRTPFDYAVREEIKAVCRSKHRPRKHILVSRVIDAIEGQDAAIVIVQRAYANYCTRQSIFRGFQEQRRRKDRRIFDNATRIQCLLRKRLARITLAQRRRDLATRNHAASVVQKYIRWRNSTFQHAVTRVVYLLGVRKREARHTLKWVLGFHVAQHLKRRRRAEEQARRKEEARRRREAATFHQQRRHRASITLSRLFRRLRCRQLVAIASTRLQARRHVAAKYSHLSAITFSRTTSTRVDATVVLHEALAADPAAQYRPAGVNQASRQFLQALEQRSVFAHGDFSAADAMMMASVLRSPNCRVERLVLSDLHQADNPAFEFDLLPAIGKCRSLRSVQLLGGAFTQGFLLGLAASVQAENPRVREVLFERVTTLPSPHPSSSSSSSWVAKAGPGAGATEMALALAAGRLLMDFFNYSMPGLASLSLHGCRLRDSHLDLVLQGLAVNSSLRSLALSCNAVTDAGLIALLEAVGANRKSSLAMLDLRHNLVECGRDARGALSALNALLSAPPSSPQGGSQGGQGQGQGQGQERLESDDPRLEIFLAWNLVSRPWPDSDSPTARKGMSLFVHTADDALPNHSPVLRPAAPLSSLGAEAEAGPGAGRGGGVGRVSSGPASTSGPGAGPGPGAGAGPGLGIGGSTGGKGGIKGMLSRASNPPSSPPPPSLPTPSPASSPASGPVPPPTPGRLFSLHWELGPGPRPSQRAKKKPKTDTSLSPARFLKVLGLSHTLS